MQQSLEDAEHEDDEDETTAEPKVLLHDHQPPATITAIAAPTSGHGGT
jgi:hypothetical protein